MQKLIMNEFGMGEYGLIIAASYALAVLLLGGVLVVSLRQLALAKQKLARIGDTHET